MGGMGYVATLPEWEKLLLKECNHLDDRYPLWNYLLDEHAIVYAVSTAVSIAT
jgi:hypothetical protein